MILSIPTYAILISYKSLLICKSFTFLLAYMPYKSCILNFYIETLRPLEMISENLISLCLETVDGKRLCIHDFSKMFVTTASY